MGCWNPCLAVDYGSPYAISVQFWVGAGHEVSEYRTIVRQIVDSGHSSVIVFPNFGRHRTQPSDSSCKTTSDRIRIASPPHLVSLLLLPAFLILPLSAIMALPLVLIGFPFMLFMEYLLIRQRLLILALKSIERLMHWQVIHIPKPHRGTREKRHSLTEFSQHIEHSTMGPTSRIFGSLCMAHRPLGFDLDSWTVELVVSSFLYMFLLSILPFSIPLLADLVFVDPAKGRLVPVNQWPQGVLNPVVGIGLLFLLGRNLLEESRDVGGNPILFATVVLTLLYGAAIVGISYRWGYSSWRGERGVRQDFETQVIDYLDPLSYDLTRKKGRIDFNVRMGMDERD